ncbi:hypothetical protein MRGA327_17725 [Mycobacterium tuberculosis RGTB327]|nr:hypothetical protein MRGA327_17725 [Mycobacterium tuberculosis RGTB327]
MDWLVRRPGPLSAISDLRLAIQDQFVTASRTTAYFGVGRVTTP